VYQTRNAADGRSLEVGLVDFLCSKGFYGPDQRSSITFAGVRFELAIASNEQKSRVRLVARQDKESDHPFVKDDEDSAQNAASPKSAPSASDNSEVKAGDASAAVSANDTDQSAAPPEGEASAASANTEGK
jgi:hypothetical protein